ncbi:Zn-dependent protease [Flavobacterium sp. H122]|uniref:Zn-dependent protease n=1 Tax=Flavobacterium sp. H122 TaxID=2529860 RepID=UPI0010AAE52E|nr:Zn-dependent protease [Flavobacterium sp. H122]
MKRLLYILVSVPIFLPGCNKEKTKQETKTVIIQPFEDISNKEIDFVEKKLKTIFSEIKINKSISFPDYTWNKTKTRHRADSLIAYLNSKAKNDEVIIGLTKKDISTSKNDIDDWGVFGLGYRPGNSCIASSYRLKGNKIDKLYKVAIHELGHTQGLVHCPVKNCFMRDAEGKDHLDEENTFCDQCKKALKRHHWNIN